MNGRVVAVVVLVGVFVAGFLCGSLGQRPAAADMAQMGGKALEQAGESGGTLGAATRLGSALVDMQDHVNALQKNLEALKAVKATLGG